MTGTYDPELDLVYWGIGNPVALECARSQGRQSLHQLGLRHSAEDRRARLVLTRRRRTTRSTTTRVQTPVIATINVGGSPRKVVIQANRSGFLYVLDAKDGKLLAANALRQGQLGETASTWRPDARIVTDVFTGALEGKNVTVWPSISGVTNWQHLSFSPQHRHALHQHPACRHDL